MNKQNINSIAGKKFYKSFHKLVDPMFKKSAKISKLLDELFIVNHQLLFQPDAWFLQKKKENK